MITDVLKISGFALFKLKWYLVITVVCLTVAVITGKTIECLMFLICYKYLRYKFPKTYHNADFYKCVIHSIIMLSIVIYLSLQFKFSILMCIPIALLTSYILYKIQEYLDLKELNTKRKTFNIETCSLKELLKQCEIKKLGKYNTDVAVKMFIDKLDTKELSKLLCIEPQSVSNKKTRLKNKLVK